MEDFDEIFADIAAQGKSEEIAPKEKNIIADGKEKKEEVLDDLSVKAENPKQKEESKTQEKVIEDDNDFLIGGDDEEDNTVDEAIMSLSKEIGADFKNKKELKQFILDSKEYKEKADSKFANEDLQKLDAYVRDGGDIKKYLNIESKIGEISSFKEEISKMSNAEAYEVYIRHKLAEDGIFDAEDIDEQVQNMLLVDEDKIERAGKRYKDDAIAQLDKDLLLESSKRDAEINGVKEKTEKFKSEIANGINALKVVDGVVVKVEQRNQMLDIAKNPKAMIRDYFPLDEAGTPVAEKWAQSLFVLSNHKNNIRLAVEKGKSVAEKKLFNELSNVDDAKGLTSRVKVANSKEDEAIEAAIQNL